MKIVGIVQARMGSSRLPGKILMPVLGIPVLQWCIERLLKCKMLDEVVIATTQKDSDNMICEFAQKKGYLFSRGSEDDVLGRYYKTAIERKADAVVRLTSDCPLIDPEITDMIIKKHIDARSNDMTSNVFTRTYPRGFDTEVLSMNCLNRINSEALDIIYREHVTNYIHDHPQKFTIENISNNEDMSHLRLCVDVEEDLALIKKVYEYLYPVNNDFRSSDIYELFKKHPELLDINSHIQQTKIFKIKNRP